jgi:hypothetical protein
MFNKPVKRARLAGCAIAALIAWVIPTLARANQPNPAVPGDTAPSASPITYPDPEGFNQRSQLTLEGLRLNTDLSTWRRGFFEKGDPGKYVPSVVYARLQRDPTDKDAIAIMNDDRSFKEHYHFAALNWARFYPLLGETVLTPETREQFANAQFRYNYLNPTGTENHKTMSMTSANVLPWYTGKGTNSKSVEDTLKEARQELRAYVKGLYAAGQGEWDSSTYWSFSVNGMLNIYDFSKDEETRLIARAALDWYVAGYALKYRDGLFSGPNQRGHYDNAVESISDRTGFLWWSTKAQVKPENLRRAFHSIEPITSSWKPNHVLTNLAKKNLPTLPAEFRNTKPNYWFGQGITHKVNGYAEVFYVDKHFSMGTLLNGHGSQITRFQIVADTDAGPVAFTGGHPARSDHTGKPEGFGYADGIGRYESAAQVGPLAMTIWNVPDDEPIDYGFFSIPPGVTPVVVGDYVILQAGPTMVGLQGFSTKPVLGETQLTPRQLEENAREVAKNRPPKHAPRPIVKFPGRKAGWIAEVVTTDQYPTPQAFADALKQTVYQVLPTEPDTFGGRYGSLRNGTIELYDTVDITNAGGILINGAPLDYKSWSTIYNGPYIQQSPGLLTVTDGVHTYTIDFTGDLPVYREGK